MRLLVQRVVDQTRARLLGGDTHVPDKVLSIFEPHTETIRKGNISKPNEFGKLVTIPESEHQIVTAYDVHVKRPADVTLWTAAWDRPCGSSDVPRISRRGIATSARRPTNRRRRIAASAASCCRVVARRLRHGVPTNTNAGSVGANGGESAVKAASVCSNADTDSTAAATMAKTACTDGSASGSSPTT